MSRSLDLTHDSIKNIVLHLSKLLVDLVLQAVCNFPELRFDLSSGFGLLIFKPSFLNFVHDVEYHAGDAENRADRLHEVSHRLGDVHGLPRLELGTKELADY